jgi:hypothetical protein
MAPFTIPITYSFLRTLSFTVLLALTCATGLSAQTLTWNANTESNLAGYRVQYGTVSGSPSTTLDVGRVTSRQFTGLQPGTTYYFRVVAYNTSGQTSPPSAQVSYTVAGTSTTTPTLTSVSPASGPTSGGTAITLTGTNFVSGATVRVGGALATSVTFVGSTRVTARTPAGTAGARDVLITNPNGRAAARTGAFTYTSTSSGTLTATSVSPLSGPTSGGTVITVAGTGFVSGATISIGGTAATGVTFVSSTRLTARTPAKPAGGYNVVVRNPNGATANTPRGFTYSGTSTPTPTPTTTPVATAVSPLSGPTTGGTLITVTGSGFVSGATIRIGGTPATGVTFVSSTRLTARTPAKAAGGYTVQVFNPNGRWDNTPRGFTYVRAGTTSAEPLAESLSAASEELSADVAAEATAAPDAVTEAAADDTTAAEGTFRRYLAEGVETDQMRTQLAIANPQETDAHATLTFETTTGAQTQMTVDVPARSRRTVDLSAVPELAGASFSTLLESDQELALDRLISFGADGSAASLETAVDQPAATWYFAEGSTIDPQELFYLVQNPGATEARVRVRYLLPNGGAPVVRTYTVAPGSRTTIWVDRDNPALASTDVAAEITSLDGTPIVVERSLYVRQEGSAAPRGGDSSAGVTAPATRWFVEGATGRYHTRLLLANPGSEAAAVRATYQRADGRSLSRSYTLAPNSRQSVDVATVHPSLANTTLGITVEASTPIVVERTKWWGVNGSLDEAVSGAGTTEGGARWLLAEGEMGGAREAKTDVSIFNQGAATTVNVTLLFEDGPEAAATFPVAAGARLSVPMADAFPAAAGRRFSVLVEAADPSASVIVDRAIFWRGADETRTAGADGAATRLR